MVGEMEIDATEGKKGLIGTRAIRLVDIRSQCYGFHVRKEGVQIVPEHRVFDEVTLGIGFPCHLVNGLAVLLSSHLCSNYQVALIEDSSSEGGFDRSQL